MIGNVRCNTTFFCRTGRGSTSPRVCLSVFFLLVVALVVVVSATPERLGLYMSALFIPCSSVALACEHQQCNQTSKHTSIRDATAADVRYTGSCAAEAPQKHATSADVRYTGSCAAGAPQKDAGVADACALVMLTRACIGGSPAACALVSLACARKNKRARCAQPRANRTRATHSSIQGPSGAEFCRP